MSTEPSKRGPWRLLRRLQQYRYGRRQRPSLRERAQKVDSGETGVAPTPVESPRLEWLGKEEELARAQRLLARAEQIVAHQTQRVFEIRLSGASSGEAERLLRTFEDVLWEWRKYVARLELGEAPDRPSR